MVDKSFKGKAYSNAKWHNSNFPSIILQQIFMVASSWVCAFEKWIWEKRMAITLACFEWSQDKYCSISNYLCVTAYGFMDKKPLKIETDIISSSKLLYTSFICSVLASFLLFISRQIRIGFIFVNYNRNFMSKIHLKQLWRILSWEHVLSDGWCHWIRIVWACVNAKIRR